MTFGRIVIAFRSLFGHDLWFDGGAANRSHRSAERAAGEELLSELLKLFRPKLIVALGGDAARCAQRVQIRHPS
jgi:hypothetical protein